MHGLTGRADADVFLHDDCHDVLHARLHESSVKAEDARGSLSETQTAGTVSETPAVRVSLEHTRICQRTHIVTVALVDGTEESAHWLN